MRGAAAAKSAFDDPTKGGAVPQGREAAPSVVFSQCKDEKFHPSSRPSGYKRWFRRLRASFRPGALKDEISEHTLQGVDILVLGAPRAKFSVDEFDALKDFIRAGGSLLVLMDEGGEEALGTNVNYLLEEYGISVNADAAVRTEGSPLGWTAAAYLVDNARTGAARMVSACPCRSTEAMLAPRT